VQLHFSSKRDPSTSLHKVHIACYSAGRSLFFLDLRIESSLPQIIFQILLPTSSTGYIMADPDTAEVESHFGFFGLAREQRDLIYEQTCMQEGVKVDLHTDGDTFAHHITVGMPMTNLLLVNRQFSSEYRDAQKGCTVVREVGSWDQGIGRTIAPFAVEAHTLEISLSLPCVKKCCARRHIKHHLKTLRLIREQMAALRVIHIRLDIDPDETTIEQDYRSLIGKLSHYQSITDVETIEIRTAVWRPWGNSSDGTGPSRLLAQWKKADNHLVGIPAKAVARA
jgi:hypothetical protein